MQQKISILGCGWLGLPLAEAFVKNKFQVCGSTTTPEKLTLLKEKNINPFLIDLNQLELNLDNKAFFESEILVVNIPPKRNSVNNYVQQITNLNKTLLNASVSKVLFVNSTSVYEPSFQEITEESPLDLNNELVTAESIISASGNPWETTIIRFAGLIGPNREPGRFLAGKTNLPEPEAPVNLIHLEDCIGVIQEIIRQGKWGEIYNACADNHPTRKEFYEAAARKLSLPDPTFDPEALPEKPAKLISNQKIKASLNYKFLYSDPLKLVQIN